MATTRRFQGVVWQLWLTVAVLLLLASSWATAAPQSAEQGWQGLLGLYERGDERLLVRERDGQLELLYGLGGSNDEWMQIYAAYPLLNSGSDVFRLLGATAFSKRQETIRFSRDKNAWGFMLQAGGREYSRHFYGPEIGQDFRIQPLLSPTELRAIAQAAEPPHEQGIFLLPDLVDITSLDPTILLDIRYATTDNFMGIALYQEPRALLQRSAAEAVVRAHRALAKYGYGLVIHDAYRPWSVTKMFWEATPDKQKMFVADPAKGSRHNRGGAVDVALVDRVTGKLVPMISGYDEFSLRALPTYPGGTSLERWRRDLLRLVMEAEGFAVYPDEWWHFDYQDWRKYPLMNIPYESIAR